MRKGRLTVGCREDFSDAHALHTMPELLAVDSVAIAEEIGRRGVVREGVHDLLGRPERGGVFGHVEVDDAPAMVSKHDEDEEHSHARAGDREEVDGDQVPDVVGEERPPGLGWRGAPLREQPGDGALGHVDAELEELAMQSRGAPEGIRRRHLPDQGLELGVDGRAAPGGPTGALGPVLAEPAALPAQDGLGGHDHEGPPPPGPDPGEPGPEETISRAKLGARRRSLVHGELVAQGEILQGELAMAAAEEGDETKQMEQGGDHRDGLSPDQGR